MLGARELGGKLVSRNPAELRVLNEIQEIEETFELCFEIPFTSYRKRMSVVLRQHGEYFVFTKGSDSVIMPRINFEYEREDQFKSGVETHLYEFAKQGLRVLVFGGRRIPEEDYEYFKKELDRIQSLKGSMRDNHLHSLYD